ncbi:ARF-GAP with GTPase, ANK repeat and PH domain-containing protein 1, partial [Elysia marginata]
AYDRLLMEEERLVTCTPLALRKNKKSSSVQKSNSFSGASELRAAVQGHPNANFLAWKNKQFFKPNFLSEKLSRYLSEFHNATTSSSSHHHPGGAYFNHAMESLTLTTGSADPAPVSNGNKAVVSPVIARLHRVRSSLSLPKSKEEEKKQAADGEKVGSGRTIPLKQGYLYKKSNGLNKEWKKKYCTLSDDGRLVYHSSLHDYMEDTHAKEIPLVRTTVKIPGMRPRGSRAVSSSGAPNGDMNNSMGFDVPADSQIDNSLIIPNSSITPVIPDQPRTRPERSPMLPKLGINSSSRDTPNVKKRHRRAKSGGVKNSNPGDGDDSDGYEFVIVSLENKQWHFEAQNGEDRDNWVDAIEQQILSSLQANDIGKNKKQNNSDLAGIQAIRSTRGNNACADCGCPSPDWASINLGALVCIECSGIHRNLGTHISRVRSLDLDDWPSDIVKVMTAVGNQTVNSVWEANLKGRQKPTQTSNRQYNANVKVVDHEGRNALWYARSSGSSECTELLTSSGCPEHPTLPRRRGSLQHQQQQQQHQGGGVGGKGDVFDKLPASVI